MKLTATLPDGRVVSRRTEHDYRWVATNGVRSTWHSRRDLAVKSAGSKPGWRVIPVNRTGSGR